MPVVRICAICAHRWTFNWASPVSWSCPKCPRGRSGDSRQIVCVCGHLFREHDVSREVENSLEALTIRGTDVTPELIASLPRHAAPLDPPLGRCKLCECSDYRRDEAAPQKTLNGRRAFS